MMMKRIFLLILVLLMIISFCGCRDKIEFSIDDLDTNKNTIVSTFAFNSNDDSAKALLKNDKVKSFQEMLSTTSVEYGYKELFNYQKAISGMLVDHSVVEHKYSALNDKGALTKEFLFDIVRKNNVEYLDKQTSLLGDIDDDNFLMRICEIIVDTTNDFLEQYPDIDKDRVYCNLGNLKIIEKKSALDFAAVEPGMILHVNRNTAQMVDLMTSSNMYSVLVHETMHILQYGCECELYNGCQRRCGIAHSYPDTKQDYSDWVWLAEGSAERLASLYSNVEPMTYKTLVNYILTLDLATMFQPDVPANYVETICFYPDVEKLFSLFNANTEEEKQEVYHMIYSLEMMQNEPNDVKQAYKANYGTEWSDEIRDDLNNKVKRPIVITLTKNFYINLTNVIAENEVSVNDILFLMNLFDSTIDYHLRLGLSEYDSYNAEFKVWYKSVQTEFMALFENITIEDYKEYNAKLNETTINAKLGWLDSNKRKFLVEKFEDNVCEYKFI